MDLFIENFDVAGMIDDAVITIQPLVEKSGNTLQTDIPRRSARCAET